MKYFEIYIFKIISRKLIDYLNSNFEFSLFLCCRIHSTTIIKFELAALAQMVACLHLVQQVRGSEGRRCTLSNRQIVHHNPGLNSKPFRSMQPMLRRHNTVDSDSSIGWGRYTWRPPWCFSRRAGYEPAPGFAFSLPFIIIPHNKITLHKQLHIQSS